MALRKPHVIKHCNSDRSPDSSKVHMERRNRKGNAFVSKLILHYMVPRPLDAPRYTTIRYNSTVRHSVQWYRHSRSVSKCHRTISREP